MDAGVRAALGELLFLEAPGGRASGSLWRIRIQATSTPWCLPGARPCTGLETQ